MLKSVVCRAEHFQHDWYRRWSGEHLLSAYHRKAWEWVAITNALHERGMLTDGKRGLGFAVGTEPLASLFASHGCSVIGSDLALDGDCQTDWAFTNQHAGSKEAMFHPTLLDRASFDCLVDFRFTDMRDLSTVPETGFDFVWSSCSLEHLGSLEAGMDFVLQSTNLLRPGGIGVHTTEYNLSSNDATAENGADVIYREQDLRQLDRDLRKVGAGLAELDLFGGTHRDDLHYDIPPYHVAGSQRAHIKLKLHGHVVTSVLLIICKY